MFCSPLLLFGVSLCPAALPGFGQMHPLAAQIVCSLSAGQLGWASSLPATMAVEPVGNVEPVGKPRPWELSPVRSTWNGTVKFKSQMLRGGVVILSCLLGKKCLEAICKAFYYLAALWCKSIFSCCVLLHSRLSHLERWQKMKLIVNTKNLLDIFYYYLFKWGPVKPCPITVGKSPSLPSVRKWWWRLGETLAGACWLAWGARRAVGAGGAPYFILFWELTSLCVCVVLRKYQDFNFQTFRSQENVLKNEA